MIDFRTSSFCSMGDCVEVGRADDSAVHLRDSKDRAQPALVFPPQEWRAFVAGVRNGEFDRT